MTKTEFREAVWNGLGRAIQYARKNDVSEFRDVILDACLHCYANDVQSEGTRASYMYELVKLTPDPASYRDEILQSLRDCGDDWDAVQRFRFASYLAMDGDAGARRAMYDNFHPGRPGSVEDFGWSLIQLDGLDGFLAAADQMGRLLIANPNATDGGELLRYAVEQAGEGPTLGALHEAAKTNQRIEAYRLVAEARLNGMDEPAAKLNDFTKLPYAQLKPRLLEIPGYRLGWWGRDANAEDLELAARDLLTADTPTEQLAYLRIFSRRAFPLDPSVLFSFLSSDVEGLVQFAANALSNITHPSIRELAFRLIETHHAGRNVAIAMLSHNWRVGDHKIVRDWFENEEDRDVRHRMEMDLRNCWGKHPDADTEVAMLLRLYEKGPCSECRSFVLDRLIKLDAVPDNLWAEFADDANEEIRTRVKP